MSRTDSFRTQHKEIVALVTDISSKLNPATLPVQADNVRSTLTTLAGKLSFHLGMEDKHLYPLMQNVSPQAKQMAEKFMAEMGALADVFKNYTQKWPLAESIKKDPEGFCTQTKEIFKALADRVQREESQLYQLADQI